MKRKRSSGGGSSGGGVGIGFGGVSGLRLAGLVGLAVTALLVLCVGSASALTTRQLESQITKANGSPFKEGAVGALTVDSSERIWVADPLSHAVYRFSPTGVYEAQNTGIGAWEESPFLQSLAYSAAVNEVFVADALQDHLFGLDPSTATYTGKNLDLGLGGCCNIQVAADNSAGATGGDLYVSTGSSVLRVEASDGAADNFTAGPSIGTNVLAGPFASVERVATAPDGDLYVGAENENIVYEFSPSGELISEVSLAGSPIENLTALAVDPSNENLLVASRGAVAEFSPGGGFLRPIAKPNEGFRRTFSMALDSTGDLFVGEAGQGGSPSNVDVFSPLLTLPDVITTAADAHSTTVATVHGEVNPAGLALTECLFEYGPTTAYDQTEECAESPSEIGAGNTFVSVHADLSGLTPGTAYHYRLVAANAEGTNNESGDQILFTGVSVDATSASEVSGTAAKLETELNPHGLLTTYHFEYDTAPYAEGEGPHGTLTPAGSAGSGTADVVRSVAIGSLAPSTTYHFHVVAENSLGTTDGPDRTFTTQPASLASLLPDSRGWELVSPPDKHGIPLESLALEGGLIQAAADGSGLAYIALGSLGPEAHGNRSALYSQQLASRAPSGGWSSHDIATAHQAPAGANPGQIGEYYFFSTDLSRGALWPEGATPLSPQASEKTPYLRNSDGSFTPLVNPANVPSGTRFGGQEVKPEQFNGSPFFITATPDLGHLLLESPKALTAEFQPTYEPTYTFPENIYEWSAGALRLVSQIPAAGASSCAGPACVPASEEGRLSNVGNSGFQVRHAISADGSRVVFGARTETVAGLASLFLRDATTGETIALDAAAPGAEGESGAAVYQDASADGSRVFFTDDHRLTVGSTATQSHPDLYLCQVEETPSGLACDLRDLTANAVDAGEPATVLGSTVGASPDGSVLYFAANGALTAGEGAVHGDCGTDETELTAQQRCNLYRYEVGSDSTELVAVLSGADANDWDKRAGNSDLTLMTSRLSPDGRFLAFMSSLPLTGYDNRDAVSRQPDEEVFLYDSSTGRLACASCNPSGARPRGFLEPETAPGPLVDRRQLWTGRWLAANLPGWEPVKQSLSLYQSRYLSDSGRLFFNSYDSLSPADTNGTADVYQFEPFGVGSCSPAAPGFAAGTQGCVGLISSGTSAEESAFLDASESGDDVFFLTASRLTGRDEDGALDIYDARVGGGEPEPVKPVECSGDTCQQPAVPSAHPTPGTLLVNGPGNVVECPKGKVKQKGKCVKKKQSKKKSKKHKKKNHKKSKNGKSKKVKRPAGHKRGGQK